MKTYLFFMIAFLITISRTMAQVLADDAEGKSSIVQYSNSINFDLAETALSVGFNNFREAKISKPRQVLWGITASAKNADGLGTLFNESQFQPESRLGLFRGVRKKITTSSEENQIETLLNEDKALAASPEVARLGRILNYRSVVEDLIETNAKLQNRQKTDLKKVINNVFNKHRNNPSLFETLDSLRKEYEVTQPEKAKTVAAIRELIRSRLTEAAEYENTAKRVFDRRFQIAKDTAILNNVRRYCLVYLSAGINAATFRAFDPSVKGKLDDRFVKTPYRGGFVDIGINYDYKANWLFGGSVGYERANTFDDNLTSTDYVVRTVDTLGRQQLVTETKYKGYTGDFRLYDRANIRTDILYFKAIDKTDFQLAWNILYTRSFVSFDSIAAKSRIDIGTGLNFYNVEKGSFLGGLYVQITDLTNSKKADTNAFGRLSFGIVAKYSFQSIANRFQ